MHAILLAAGSSRRMAGAVPDKVLAPLAGKPAFAHTAATFVRSGVIDFFVVTYRDQQQMVEQGRDPGLQLMVQHSDAQPEADWGPEGSLLQVALPEVAQQLTPTQARLWMTMVDRARPEHRLTALLWPMRRWLTAHPQVLATPRALDELLDERLKLPLTQRQQLTALLSPLPVDQPQHTPRDAVSLRRCAAAHPPELLSQRWTLLSLEAELQGDTTQSAHFTQLQQQLAAELAHKPPKPAASPAARPVDAESADPPPSPPSLAPAAVAEFRCQSARKVAPARC